MRKESGVYIIEVKDWQLEHYYLNERFHWYVKKSGGDAQIKSPISQVYRYKENLYNLHIEGLLEKKIKNPKMLSIVNCGIYFHNASTKEFNAFAKNEDQKSQIDQDRYNRHLKFLSYFDLFGRDELSSEKFMRILDKRWMTRQSRLFTEALYTSFKRYLNPPKHIIEQGIHIAYSDEQQRIIDSEKGNRKKVKGVAGSGKTMCLAKRAVNAHKRHQNHVLILTYNISLRNYIHDKINEIREEFHWTNFHVVHYHEFFKNQANNHNLIIRSWKEWENPKFFETVKHKIQPYDSIIIDEVQDYRKPWIDLLHNYFLSEKDGEYVVFGDEKQNIYQRIYDEIDKKPYTKIGGNWNLLKRSYRITNDIARLAESFQEHFFDQKYELDTFLIQRELFENSIIQYYQIESFDEQWIFDLYRQIAIDNQIHDNDICFQASTVEPLRYLDYYIRHNSNNKTNTMFETQEIYLKLLNDFNLTLETLNEILTLYGKLKRNESITEEEQKAIKNYELFMKEIEKVRRNKKFNFWNNRGFLKLSTIHSFKGWEADTLFLLIEKSQHNEQDESDFTTEELIYTAITRCRTNLFIINLGNEKFHDFFSSEI